MYSPGGDEVCECGKDGKKKVYNGRWSADDDGADGRGAAVMEIVVSGWD